MQVASDLKAGPDDIVFIDDNGLNIAAAQELGFSTILHTANTDLREELARLAG